MGVKEKQTQKSDETCPPHPEIERIPAAMEQNTGI
jgi:hypothetical protein